MIDRAWQLSFTKMWQYNFIDLTGVVYFNRIIILLRYLNSSCQHSLQPSQKSCLHRAPWYILHSDGLLQLTKNKKTHPFYVILLILWDYALHTEKYSFLKKKVVVRPAEEIAPWPCVQIYSSWEATHVVVLTHLTSEQQCMPGLCNNRDTTAGTSKLT